MGDKRDRKQDGDGVDVLIEHNTMQVGNEIYHLGNIARVSTYVRMIGFQGGPLKAIWSKRLQIILILVGLLVFGSSDDGAAHLVVALLLLAAVATIIQIVRMLQGQGSAYVLLIESSGVVRGVLESHNQDVIGEIVDLISRSIRNPPVRIERHYTDVTTNVTYNETTQYGPGSVGQQTVNTGR